MRERGQRLAGIRLDSGDLAYLSIRAREMLDAAGFEDTQVVASNDLDPATIESLQAQGARIDMLGRRDQARDLLRPAGAGRRVQADRDPAGRRRVADAGQGERRHREDHRPGRLGVRRFYDADGTARADMIWDELGELDGSRVIVDPASTRITG